MPDRNFDGIADYFEKKVYGGLKGDIRLAVLRRDIQAIIPTLSKQIDRPLRILDMGAGLAQISIELSLQGHDVVINDISKEMISKAQYHAQQLSQNTNLTPNITWHIGSYQSLSNELKKPFDMILCHALIEWLEVPKYIMDFADDWLVKEGILSLCFYNPASFIYRNLIMGNFKVLENPRFKADTKKSLTPNHPVASEEVIAWLDEYRYDIVEQTGIRVFHDYVMEKRGGNANSKDIIEMELKYSKQEPFKRLGRYLHILAKKQ